MLQFVDPESSTVLHPNRLVIAGLGGSGKTELVRELATQISATLPQTKIFWLDGSTAHKFAIGFRSVLRLPGDQASENLRADLAFVKHWLESNDSLPWLIIIDDVRINTLFGEERLHELLPNNANGHVIMISRNRQLAGRFTPPTQLVDMHGMELSDARDLLLSLLPNCSQEPKEIDNIILQFESLPLGIVQAGLFMSSHNISTEEYLSVLKDSDSTTNEVLMNGLSISRSTTCETSESKSQVISLEDVAQQNSLATVILATISCMAGQDIPASLIKHLFESVDLGDSISTLKAYSIIKPGYMPDTHDCNILARAVIRSQFRTMPFLFSSIIALLNVLALEFPTDFKTLNSLRRGRRYASHISSFIYTVLDICSEHSLKKKELKLLGTLSSRLSYLLRDLGSYSEVNKIGQKFLDWTPRRTALNFECQDTMLNHIAVSAHCMGRFETASRVSQTVLAAQPSPYVCDNPETIRAMNTLALSHHSRGDFTSALECHFQALSMKKRLLGENHLDTLKTLNNLGICFQAQDKHLAAEGLFRQVLQERKRMLEPDNPYTLRSLNNLAISLQHLGKYSEAEELYREAVDGKIRVWGPGHHEVLRSMSNLTAVLYCQNKTHEAEQVFREVVRGFEKLVGKEHPESIQACENLATFLRNEKRYEEAESILREMLPAVRKCYGERDAKTLAVLRHLTILLHHQNKYAEALKSAIFIQDIRQQDLGDTHRDTQAAIKHVRQLEQLLQPNNEGDRFSDDKELLKGGKLGIMASERPLFYRYLNLLVAIPHMFGIVVLVGIWGMKMWGT
jgi:tetratricopeptide (TPR) repeat protein